MKTYFLAFSYLPIYSAFSRMWDFMLSSNSLRLEILAPPTLLSSAYSAKK